MEWTISHLTLTLCSKVLAVAGDKEKAVNMSDTCTDLCTHPPTTLEPHLVMIPIVSGEDLCLRIVCVCVRVYM